MELENKILEKQFVFIIGAPRSGSTWLSRILASHPEVASTDAELTVFDSYVGPWLRSFDREELFAKKSKSSKGLPHVWPRKQFDDFVMQFIEKVYSSLRILPQHKVIVDKHPIYSYYVKEINYFLPHAKYINIIRDGREMAHSWNRMWEKEGWGNPTFLGACLDWVKFNRGARTAQALAPENYLEVRYENLLSNTDGEIERILSFCNIDSSREVRSGIVAKNTGEKSMVSSPNPQFSFQDKMRGKVSWRTLLSKDEIFISRKHIGKELVEYGYEKNENWGLNALEWMWCLIKYRTPFIVSMYRKLKSFIYKSGKPIYAALFIKNKCSACGFRPKSYLPLKPYFQEQLEKFGHVPLGKPETANVESYSCPSCMCSDRDRLYSLYFKEVFSKLRKDKTYNFLDIAPYKPLGNFIDKYKFIKRRTADLLAPNVDDKLNIEDMHIYQDESFNFFLCSHVLEHVESPEKAMKELYRVLKKGGQGIAMVPIIIGLEETIENPSHKTEAERWKYYGQGDHLRQFGKRDFINRLERAGFKVRLLGIDHFGRKAFRENSLLDSSLLYIVEK